MGAPAFKLPFASIRSVGPQTRKFMSFIKPTGVERTFANNDIIVSKTDLKGNITYANKVFLDLASLEEARSLAHLTALFVTRICPAASSSFCGTPWPRVKSCLPML